MTRGINSTRIHANIYIFLEIKLAKIKRRRAKEIGREVRPITCKLRCSEPRVQFTRRREDTGANKKSTPSPTKSSGNKKNNPSFVLQFPNPRLLTDTSPASLIAQSPKRTEGEGDIRAKESYFSRILYSIQRPAFVASLVNCFPKSVNFGQFYTRWLEKP